MTGTAHDRGDRVHEDLRAAGRRDPDEPADDPRRRQRPDLQDQGGQVDGRRRGDRRAPRERPAGARRHDLRRGLRAARRAPRRRSGIKHTVLNAKPEYAEREGETVAEAGQLGAVTIATNMAGRGVDIKLGGNAEHLDAARARRQARPRARHRRLRGGVQASCCPKYEEQVEADRETVMEAGGLAIIGTERHESRRIDNQLRGRAGRQGDPGSSQFFLSGEDDLVRLFAGDRIYNILDRFGEDDEKGHEVPIQAGMLSKQIEKAQQQGRGAELPHPQARPRIRRRDERAAARHLQAARLDPRGRQHLATRRARSCAA